MDRQGLYARSMPSLTPTMSDQTTESPEPLAQRSADVWFTDDRTIIVKAESTLFRAYSGLLAHHSSVLRDMFLIPQPDGTEKIDGCPVVPMFDTVDDVRLFLKILHDPTEYVCNSQRRSVSLISAMCRYHRALSKGEDIIVLLKMSHKYEAWLLHRQLLEYLTPMFPRTLDSFIESESQTAQQHTPFDYRDFDFNVRIANLARVIEAHHLLPVALYRLCHTPPPTVQASELSTDNLIAVLVGRSHLAKRARHHSFIFLFQPMFYPKGFRPNCPWNGCSPENLLPAGALSATMSKLLDDDCWLDPFAKCDLSFPRCSTCSTVIESDYKKEQSYSWDHLPEFFGLGATWDELERGREGKSS